MVTYYRGRIKLCYKGKFIKKHVYKFLSEVKKTNFSGVITWDNLDEMMNKYGIFLGEVYNTKKGRKFIIWFEGDMVVIKEWKTPLNITIEVTYDTNFRYSLKDILNDNCADLAIKYLLERGIRITKELL